MKPRHACVCLLSHFSHVWLFVTLWTVAYQPPLSMGLSRQECWSGLPFPSPGGLPVPGVEPRSPALQADSLPTEPPGSYFTERNLSLIPNPQLLTDGSSQCFKPSWAFSAPQAVLGSLLETTLLLYSDPTHPSISVHLFILYSLLDSDQQGSFSFLNIQSPYSLPLMNQLISNA